VDIGDLTSFERQGPVFSRSPGFDTENQQFSPPGALPLGTSQPELRTPADEWTLGNRCGRSEFCKIILDSADPDRIIFGPFAP
jgi:hypothetical protein